ncbi:ankyrin repeat domain-containing protein 61-like [Glandiceps talaboti]
MNVHPVENNGVGGSPCRTSTTLHLLHDAIVKGDVPYCEKLVHDGVPVNEPLLSGHGVASPHRNEYRDTGIRAIHAAVIYRRPEIVDLLLRNGADPNQPDRLGRRPSHLVVIYWPRGRITFDDDSDITLEERKYRNYLTTLHQKCRRSLRSLWNAGANVNEPMNNEFTPLHFAAYYNTAGSVKDLVRYGADVNAINENGEKCTTPVMLAAHCGNETVLQEIIKYGGNIYCHSPCAGHNLLHLAATNSRNLETAAECVKILLQHGLLPNVQDERGRSPLHFAAQNGNADAIDCLLDFGANPDLLDHQGNTAVFGVFNNLDNFRFNSENLPTYIRLMVETLHPNIYQQRLPTVLSSTKSVFVNYLLEKSKVPVSLTAMCRHIIRRTLALNTRGKASLATVSQLQLPNSLKRFIADNNEELKRLIKDMFQSVS